MFEIDCSNLPDDIARYVMKKVDEESNKDIIKSRVNILYHSKIIIIYGNRNKDYGHLRSYANNAVSDYLQNQDNDYSREEIEKYRLDTIEFHSY